jgi:hypothetical protein
LDLDSGLAQILDLKKNLNEITYYFFSKVKLFKKRRVAENEEIIQMFFAPL